MQCRQTLGGTLCLQVDVAPPGMLAATLAEVRAVLGAAAAGAGVAAGVPAGARGAVSTPLVTSEEQVRCCGALHCPCYGLFYVATAALPGGFPLAEYRLRG